MIRMIRFGLNSCSKSDINNKKWYERSKVLTKRLTVRAVKQKNKYEKFEDTEVCRCYRKKKKNLIRSLILIHNRSLSCLTVCRLSRTSEILSAVALALVISRDVNVAPIMGHRCADGDKVYGTLYTVSENRSRRLPDRRCYCSMVIRLM